MKLFSWGANTYGQLGHGVKSDQCILPMEIPESGLPIAANDIISITGGGGHTLMLDKYGHVYSCGWNSKGQLGLPMDSDVLTFKKITALQQYKIVKVFCGWDSSMAITEDGTLLAWGSNVYGQLGLPKTKVTFSSSPVNVRVPPIATLAMGLRHTALVTKSGNVFTCGDGRKGQLGLVDCNHSPLKERDKPTRVRGVRKALQVSCGQYNTIVMTPSGKFYGWGENKYGQLGISPEDHPKITIPFEILTLTSDVLVQSTLLSGWTHTNLVIGGGVLMNWGRNTYSQLGCTHHERPESWRPTLLNLSPDMKYIAVGSEHNMAISGSKHVWCWGWNEHGNCGVGTEVDVHMPTRVTVGGGKHNAVLIGCGAANCFAVMEG